MSNKQTYIPLIAGLFLMIGVYIGMKWGGEGIQPLSISLSPKQNKLTEVLDYIDYSYVDSVEKDAMIEDAINSLLTDLDPHSQYISARDLNLVNEPLEGNFEGIGVQFRIINDTVAVIRPIQGGPSQKVGVAAGDQIITVDDSLIAGNGVTNRTIMSLLKGPKNSEVTIQVQRGNQDSLLSFTIVRDRIPIQSVDAAYMMEEGIAYLKLAHFAKTTADEVLDSLASLSKQGMESLVLDLRGNGGGILQSAIRITEALLPKGLMIVYTEGKAQPKTEYRTTRDGEYKDLPITILIDEQSASASEILSGALQDNDRGTIVGRRSFGKGLVQEQVELGDRSALRLTVARYYTPSGRSIQKPYKGVDYGMDLQNRFESGEFYSADSIEFPDSLIYKTLGGDTVYGGGGIMPDKFVPLKQGVDTGWYGELFYSGALNDMVYNDAKEIRKALPSEDAFIREFQLSALQRKRIAEKLEVKTLKKSEDSERRYKAFLGRNLYGENCFFRLWNENDTVIEVAKKALAK